LVPLLVCRQQQTISEWPSAWIFGDVGETLIEAKSIEVQHLDRTKQWRSD